MKNLAKDVAFGKVFKKSLETTILLAGGQSSRMGSDKTQMRLGAETLLERAIRRLGGLTEETIIVTNDHELEVENAAVTHDRVPHLGPMGGILAGLTASKSKLNLVVAVDMPFVKFEIIELLVEEAHADAIVPLLSAGPEPLLALYGKNCIQAIEDQLSAGERKTISFFDDVAVKFIPEDELRRVDPDLVSFANVNTMQDFEQARRLLEADYDR